MASSVFYETAAGAAARTKQTSLGQRPQEDRDVDVKCGAGICQENAEEMRGIGRSSKLGDIVRDIVVHHTPRRIGVCDGTEEFE